MAVNWGYVEVEEDKVTVLVETAEPADEIDLERAKAALGRAEEALKKLTPEDKDFLVMQAALERALIRIQVAGAQRVTDHSSPAQNEKGRLLKGPPFLRPGKRGLFRQALVENLVDLGVDARTGAQASPAGPVPGHDRRWPERSPGAGR